MKQCIEPVAGSEKPKLEFTPLEFETKQIYGNTDQDEVWLEFTPLEFETQKSKTQNLRQRLIRIYSVGVWNGIEYDAEREMTPLEFTPLEFETQKTIWRLIVTSTKLEFTPLEFETSVCLAVFALYKIRIYSVGVWNYYPF